MIESASNPRVKLVCGLQSRRRLRNREQRTVVEGTRLVGESLTAMTLPDFVLFTPEWESSPVGLALLERLTRLNVPAIPTDNKIMRICSDTESAPGVLAVIPTPQLPPPAEPTFVVLIDRLRTPGNLGTILRTAAAAGAELVLLPPGNVDPFNPKVMRGGMGAHFRIPLLKASWQKIESYLSGLDTWIAAAGTGKRYDLVDWTQRIALIVGGEASGASSNAFQLAKGQVHIPMPGGMESLNAAIAAGILFFEIARQRAGV